jgi:hypothetical protein
VLLRKLGEGGGGGGKERCGLFRIVSYYMNYMNWYRTFYFSHILQKMP